MLAVACISFRDSLCGYLSMCVCVCVCAHVFESVVLTVSVFKFALIRENL